MNSSASPQAKLFNIESADISKYPPKLSPELLAKLKGVPSANAGKTIYVGDAHGNVLLLVWLAIYFGFIKMSEENYLKIVAMCRKSQPEEVMDALFGRDETTGEVAVRDGDGDLVMMHPCDIFKSFDEDLAEFRKIMNKMEVLDKDTFFKWIGDEFFDRKSGDQYTALFFKELIVKGCKLKSKISNHALDYLYAVLCNKLEPSEYAIRLNDDFEFTNLDKFQSAENEGNPEGRYFDALTVQTGGCNLSGHNMGRLIERGILKKEEIIDFVRNYYIPNLELVSVTRDKLKASTTISAHASSIAKPKDSREKKRNKIPQDAVTLNKLFILFGIDFELKHPFDDAKTKELLTAVDNLNAAFRHKLQTASAEEIREMFTSGPVYDLVWNRNSFEPDEEDCIFDFHINGHDKSYATKGYKSVICIDHDTTKVDLEPGDLPIAVISFSFTPEKSPLKRLEEPETSPKKQFILRAKDLNSETPLSTPYKTPSAVTTRKNNEGKVTDVSLFREVSASQNITVRRRSSSARLGHAKAEQ